MLYCADRNHPIRVGVGGSGARDVIKRRAPWWYARALLALHLLTLDGRKADPAASRRGKMRADRGFLLLDR